MDRMNLYALFVMGETDLVSYIEEETVGKLKHWLGSESKVEHKDPSERLEVN